MLTTRRTSLLITITLIFALASMIGASPQQPPTSSKAVLKTTSPDICCLLGQSCCIHPVGQ